MAKSVKNKKNILFVDDEERIIIALKLLFRRDRNINVFTTTNQAEAIDFVKNNQIHVVVSDMRMPGMNGAELLSHVKKISPNTLRILLTGYSEMDNIIKSINTGQVYRFLQKPWDNEDIKAKIETAIQIATSLWDNNICSEPESQKAISTINKATESASLAPSSQSVLFIGNKNSTIFKTLTTHFDNIKIYHSSNAQKAVVAISKYENVMTVVVHTETYYHDVVTLLKILKGEFPMLVSVIVTNESDSELAISLVNEAQVFRYLVEPVNNNQLCSDVTQALNYSKTLSNSPILVKQHTVEKVSQTEKNRLLDLIGFSFIGNLSQRFMKLKTLFGS